MIRDEGEGGPFEVLMLRRNSEGGFAGMWVFPGGRVDPDDGEGDLGFRLAAIREVKEETGLQLDLSSLTPFAFWVPQGKGKRFDTMFFIAMAPSTDVHVDGSEIEEFTWGRPAELLNAHSIGTLPLVAPTWRNLAWLAAFPSAEAAIAGAQHDGIARFTGRMRTSDDGGRVVLWHGDAAYDDGSLDDAGPRHRLYIATLPWRLERTDEYGNDIPP